MAQFYYNKDQAEPPRLEWQYSGTYEVSTGHGAVEVDLYNTENGEFGFSSPKKDRIHPAGNIADIHDNLVFEVLEAIAQIRLKDELSEAQVKSNITSNAIRQRNPDLVRIIKASVR